MSRRHRSSLAVTQALAAALGLLGVSSAYADPPAAPGQGVQPFCDKALGHKFHCKGYRVVDEKTRKPLVITDAFTPKKGGALTAAQIASLYQIDTTRKPGATIGIVDAYGYANAESDLAAYRSSQKLSTCTVASGCLTIVNQTGATSPMPPAPPSGDDWNGETSLDIDMASAVCPNCKILLVLADDDQGDGLYIGQQTAASLGASVISNSWGGPDPDGSGTTEGEPYFQVNPAINIFVATGDAGWDNLIGSSTKSPGGPDYPSTSLYVIGVGGTNVTLTTAGLRATETAWSDGGSSCSVINPKPAYQNNFVTAAACGFRAASDVAAIGGTPGVITYEGGAGSAEGTSVASPLVASIFALYGMSKSDPGFPYAHASAFYDVTSGSNAASSTSQSQFNCTTTSTNKLMCNATTGWDGPTGMGTPIGSAFASIAPEPTPAAGADMAIASTDMAAPAGSDLAVPPGSGDMAQTASHDLAQGEHDLATTEDLAPGDDLSTGTGGNGPGGGGGTGQAGGTGTGGGGGSGGNNGCGCTLGGANSGNSALALPFMLALLGFVIFRRRRA